MTTFILIGCATFLVGILLGCLATRAIMSPRLTQAYEDGQRAGEAEKEAISHELGHRLKEVGENLIRTVRAYQDTVHTVAARLPLATRDLEIGDSSPLSIGFSQERAGASDEQSSEQTRASSAETVAIQPNDIQADFVAPAASEPVNQDDGAAYVYERPLAQAHGSDLGVTIQTDSAEVKTGDKKAINNLNGRAYDNDTQVRGAS